MGFANFQWIYICIFIKIYPQNEPFSGECTLSTLNQICLPLFMFGNGIGGTFITTIALLPCSPSSQFRPARAGSRKWKITKNQLNQENNEQLTLCFCCLILPFEPNKQQCKVILSWP